MHDRKGRAPQWDGAAECSLYVVAKGASGREARRVIRELGLGGKGQARSSRPLCRLGCVCLSAS